MLAYTSDNIFKPIWTLLFIILTLKFGPDILIFMHFEHQEGLNITYWSQIHYKSKCNIANMYIIWK